MFKILNKKKTITFVIFSRANYNSIKSVIDEVKKNKKDFTYKIIVGASAVGKKFGNIIKKLKVMLFLLLEIDLKPWQPQ